MTRRELLAVLGGVALCLFPPLRARAETPMPTAVPFTPTPSVTPTPTPVLTPLPSPVSFDEASFMVLARSLTDLERAFYAAVRVPLDVNEQFKFYMQAIQAVREGALNPWHPYFWRQVKARQSGVGAELLLDDETMGGKV